MLRKKITLIDPRKQATNTRFSFHLDENEPKSYEERKSRELEKKKYGLALQAALKQKTSSDAIFKKLYPIKNSNNKYTLVYELDYVLQIHPEVQIPDTELDKIEVKTEPSNKPLESVELDIIDTLVKKQFYDLPLKGHLSIVYSCLSQAEMYNEEKIIFSNFAQVLKNLDEKANLYTKVQSLQTKIISNLALSKNLSESMSLHSANASMEMHPLWTGLQAEINLKIEEFSAENTLLAQQKKDFADHKQQAKDALKMHTEHRSDFLNKAKIDVVTVLQNSALEYWLRVLYANSGSVTQKIIEEFNLKFPGIAEILREEGHLPLRIIFPPKAANKTLAEIKICIDNILSKNPKPSLYQEYYIVSMVTGYAPTCTLKTNLDALNASLGSRQFEINNENKFIWNESIVALEESPECHTKQLEDEIKQLEKTVDGLCDASGAAAGFANLMEKIAATKADLTQIESHIKSAAPIVEDAKTKAAEITRLYEEMKQRINAQEKLARESGISLAGLKASLVQLQLENTSIQNCKAHIIRKQTEISAAKTLADSTQTYESLQTTHAGLPTKIEAFQTHYKNVLAAQEQVDAQHREAHERNQKEHEITQKAQEDSQREEKKTAFIAIFIKIRNALLDNIPFWHAQTTRILGFGGTTPDGYDLAVPKGIAEMIDLLGKAPRDQAISFEYAKDTMAGLQKIGATANQRSSTRVSFTVRKTPIQLMYDLAKNDLNAEYPDAKKIEKQLDSIHKRSQLPATRPAVKTPQKENSRSKSLRR